MAQPTAFPPLSASVTRILSVSGFPAHLKTRDIQTAFGEWENVNGGFKIKWIDDTNLLMVFADAGVAKRAYLQALASPHAVFSTPTTGPTVTIRPYDGADAQAVIAAVNSRQGGPGHRTRASMSAGTGPSAAVAAAQAHIRGVSTSAKLNGGAAFLGREPSPTLPALPNQPTLNALISSSLDLGGAEEPAAASGTPPKVGDPARRMVGHALGIRHPGLGASRGSNEGMAGLQKALASVSVSE